LTAPFRGRWQELLEIGQSPTRDPRIANAQLLEGVYRFAVEQSSIPGGQLPAPAIAILAPAAGAAGDRRMK
jgi:hypothetical protein